MFKIKAKFIGVDSLGFNNGHIYDISLIDFPHINGMIEISTNDGSRLRCEYASWERFIPNWEILHFENMTGGHMDTKVNNGLKQSVRDSKISKVLS